MGNTSYQSGGGACFVFKCTPLIYNCEFINNVSVLLGSVIHSEQSNTLTILNCLLSENSIDTTAGEISTTMKSLTKIINCSIANNKSSMGESIISLSKSMKKITNSIVWFNDSESQIPGDETIISYSNIEGGYEGEGNIEIDPLFVSGPRGDYYLSQTSSGQLADSPCVDGGGDLASEVGLDNLTTRTDGVRDHGMVDMGYHAYTLLITAMELNDGRVLIRWNAKRGVNYLVRVSADMESWADIPVGEADSWIDVHASGRQRFYMVVAQ